MEGFRHNQARDRPVTPGTSSPSPTATLKAIIAPDDRSRPGAPGKTLGWSLFFEPQSPHELDALTGWVLSGDPLTQVRLRFRDMQSAIAFAERKGWRYEVCAPRSDRRAVH